MNGRLTLTDSDGSVWLSVPFDTVALVDIVDHPEIFHYELSGASSVIATLAISSISLTPPTTS